MTKVHYLTAGSGSKRSQGQHRRPAARQQRPPPGRQVCRARLRRVRHGPKRAKRARQLRGEPPAAAGGDGGLGGIGSAQGA